jgi:hypothetical protein
VADEGGRRRVAGVDERRQHDDGDEPGGEREEEHPREQSGVHVDSPVRDDRPVVGFEPRRR